MKHAGRFTLSTSGDPESGYWATVSYNPGWNDFLQWKRFNASIEELRDLRYLIDRVIKRAESP